MTTMDRHPETAFVPFVREELAPDERARVAAHLAACEPCRAAVAEVRHILGALAAAPAPLEPRWARYRAELRARIDADTRPPRWWRRSMPVAVSAALAAAVLLFVLRPAPVDQRPVDLAALEETTIGARLDMLEHYDVVQRLELLEEMDVIRQLDVVPARNGG
jgi:anti-sigma factor RsiW